MTRASDTLARAIARRDAPERPIAVESRHVAIIDGRGSVSTRHVSVAAIEALAGMSADDVDPSGAWTGRRNSPGRHDVTGLLLGDLPAGRSALDMRGRG